MVNYQFRLMAADDTYVRLDSLKCSIQVQYDRARSFEVGVEFCELVNGECSGRVPFNLGEVLRECGAQDVHAASFFQSRDLLQVRGYLIDVVDRLLEYCEPVLKGDHHRFEAVRRRRTLESADYTRRIRLQSVRAEAHAAWQARRYGQFVLLFEEFMDLLPKSDRKKLEYAKEKLSNL